MESPRSVAGVLLSSDVRILADRRRLQFAEYCFRIGSTQWRFMSQGGRNVFGQREGPCLVEVKAVVEVVCLDANMVYVLAIVTVTVFIDNSVRLLDVVVCRPHVAGVVCQISSFDNCRYVYCCLFVSVYDALRTAMSAAMSIGAPCSILSVLLIPTWTTMSLTEATVGVCSVAGTAPLMLCMASVTTKFA